jgi:hypothetical protein
MDSSLFAVLDVLLEQRVQLDQRIAEIISQIRREASRQTTEAAPGSAPTQTRTTQKTTTKKRRLTAAGRKAISDALRRRHAEKKAAQQGATTKKSRSEKNTERLSESHTAINHIARIAPSSRRLFNRSPVSYAEACAAYPISVFFVPVGRSGCSVLACARVAIGAPNTPDVDSTGTGSGSWPETGTVVAPAAQERI